MKPITLMIIFPFMILAASLTKSTKIEKNSSLIEDLSEDNLTEHASRIHRRSILKLLLLKPRYRPIPTSVNWRKSSQQRFTKNYNTRWNHEIIYKRRSSFHIQKNIFFFNGLDLASNQQSTTPKYFTSTKNADETKSTMTTEDIFSKPSVQQTESTLTTRFVSSTSTSTEAAVTTTSTPKVGTTKTTPLSYEITTSTTEMPATTNVVTTTESIINMVTNSLKTTSPKGGFTSTSMPQNNEYSDLIYDIDPRYRI